MKHGLMLMWLLLAAALFAGCGGKGETETEAAAIDAPAADATAYDALRGLRDPAARMEAMEAFLADFPESDRRGRVLGGLFRARHDTDPVEAITWARRALESERTDLGKGALYLALFGVHLESGDKIAALNTANAMWDARVDDPGTLNAIGWALVEDTGWDPALGAEMGQRAADLTDDHSKGMYLDTAGWGYYKAGDYEKAKRAMETALATLDEPELEYTTHMVAIYEKTGDEDAMFDLIEMQLGTCVNRELRAKAEAILLKRGGDLKAFDEKLWAAREARATRAPDFELGDLDGRPVKLSDFGGKVLLVNFFFPT